ncbi:MAG: hypothetical protein GY864_00275 [Desulfobacterales bacterium]|nr:hypothetical protein [Desulfobacterales bacterium]
MKKLVKCLVVLMALTMASGVAYAANLNEHVKVAPNHIGDLLIMPFYLTLDGGWDTKICVTNTSTTHCVVAKVVFRSWVNSEEVLDFLIFLTPTDKWCGNIYYSQTGAAIYSADDSVLVGIDGCEGTFATDSNPQDQAFYPVECGNGAGNADYDLNYFGYAEVIEIWSRAISGDPDGLALVGERSVVPVSKTLLYRYYCTWQASGSWENDEIPQNVLTGGMEFYNDTVGYYGERKMKVLRDYQNREFASIAYDTVLGDIARNSLGEIEAALSARRFAGNYYNGDGASSIHFLTFPTKLTNVHGPTAVAPYDPCDWESNGGQDEDSPFWSGTIDARCVNVSTPAYDMSENTVLGGNIYSGGTSVSNRMCEEVTMRGLSTAPFSEGWIAYDFNYTSTFTNGAAQAVVFTGIPGIYTRLNFAFGGMSLSPGAWDDGVTTVDDVYVPYYQYADFPTDYTGPIGYVGAIDGTPVAPPTTGTVNRADPGSD